MRKKKTKTRKTAEPAREKCWITVKRAGSISNVSVSRFDSRKEAEDQIFSGVYPYLFNGGYRVLTRYDSSSKQLDVDVHVATSGDPCNETWSFGYTLIEA